MNKKPVKPLCKKCKKDLSPKDPSATPRKQTEKKVYFLKEGGHLVKAFSAKKKATDAKASRPDPNSCDIVELPLNV